MIQKILLLFAITLLSACSFRTSIDLPEEVTVIDEATTQNKKATNVILMIGDGMGLSQMTAGYIENNMFLNLERTEVIGLSKTNSSSDLITDSAAGATAFSIGEKTYNGAIGVDKNKIPKETILETLAKQGLSTGIVATCNITHATPASFYAHQPSRKMYYEIAADMVNAPITFFAAGGKMHFADRTSEKEGKPDERDLLEEMEKRDFTFVDNLNSLHLVNGKVGYFYSHDHPVSILKGRDSFLPDTMEPAIQHLLKESEEGFFLVVEGSQIDWGGHANDSEYIITEMIDFDKAVGKVLDFAERDGNTLVIITADHETGGYALNGKENNYNELEGSFTTGGHTGVMVPVYAYGPQAELFQGIYNNNDIYKKMRLALGR